MVAHYYFNIGKMARLAQLEEHLPYKKEATRSIRVPGTRLVGGS